MAPPCKKRFLAKSIQDLGEFTRHYGLTPPEGHDLSLKALERKSWAWFARSLHDVSGEIYSASIDAYLRPMDRQWGSAMAIAYEPARVGGLVFIWDAHPCGNLERYLDAVGVLVEIDREKNPNRLYEDDGGPARCSQRYHLQKLDGSTVSWGNCAPRNVISHRITEMNRQIVKDLTRDRWPNL